MILFPFLGINQVIQFDIEPEQVEVGELITINNHSDALEDGHFVFLFQYCSFILSSSQEPDIVCKVETTDHNAVIEGFFWQAGDLTVTLLAIDGQGDTLESQYVIQVEVSPFFTTTPIDSCPDTSAYNCNNLVCNGSFEWNSSTVYFLDQLNFAAPWRNLFGSCDLFSENTTGFYGPWADIPDNIFGHQWAHTGNAYMGLGVFLSSNTCEIATSQLKSPLKQGQRYGVEYFTSKAEIYPYSCNGAQVFFSVDEIQASSYQDLLTQLNPNYLLDALGNTIITDTVNWVRFYDVFIPPANDLEWISIGQTRLGVDILLSYDPSMGDAPSAYYYYDDISVVPLPPLVSLVQDTFYINACDTVEFRVIGEGAGSYLWSNASTQESIKVSPAVNTVYSVTVYDPELCHDTVLYGYVFIIDLNWKTVARITGQSTDCGGRLQTYSLENGMPGYRYEWNISSNHGIFTANATQSLILYGPDPVEIHWNNLPDVPGFALITLAQYNQCEELLGIDTFKVFECCFPDVGYVLKDTTITDTVFTSIAGPYIIYGTLIIDAVHNVTFDLNPNGRIYMGPEAKIVIKNPNTELILDSCVFLSGCEYMWDGIYLPDSTMRLKANNSIFSDAINTIVADSGAMLEIRDCVFKDNYKSIVIRNFAKSGSPAMLQNYPLWPMEIYGTEFYQSGFPGQTLQYPPFNGVHAKTAIMIQDADTIVVGKPGEDPNYFHHLSQAIIVKNGNGEIINNEFADIGIESETYPPEGAVDIMRTGSAPLTGIETRVGNGTTAGKNSFERCWHPITTYQNPVIIHRNEFLDCDYGIHCLDLRNRTRIVSNNFSQSSTSSLTGVTAITLQNVTTSPKLLNILVDTNYIQGYQKGIWTTNVDKQTLGTVRYSYNDIYFNVLGYPVSGIKIDNGTGSLISDNLIRSVSRPDSTMGIGRHNGIWTNYSQGALITHNQLLRMGNGIYTTGPGLNTFFVCNALDSCYFGLYFGESTSLSHQGVFDEYNTANHWLGDYSSNGCSYWRRMMQVIGNISNPVINWYYPITYSVYDPGTNHCGINHPPYLYVDEIENNDAQADCHIFSPAFDVFNISTAEEREMLLGALARGEIQYDTLQVPYREKEGDFFYRIANHDPQILSFGDTTDVAYQQYYQHLSQGKTGMKESVYQHIHEGEYLQAYYLNESLPDTSRRDILRKRVNRIYLNTWCQQGFTFSSADRDSLIVYAYGNPYAMGDGVFSARVLLGLDPDRVPLTQSAVVKDKQSPVAQIVLYPNPGQDKVCFVWETGQAESGSLLAFELFDSFGKKVVDKSVANQHGEICVQLPGNISPGLYIVRIGEQSGNKVAGKIIIR